MKPSLLSLAVPIALASVAACAPSPYYSGTKGGFAPGAVPRDGYGRPILDGKAVEYVLPAPTPAVAPAAGNTAPAYGANQIIYYEDLHYSGRAQANQNAALARSPTP